MRKLSLILFLLFSSAAVYAQSPDTSTHDPAYIDEANIFIQDQKIKSLDPSLDIDIDPTGLNGGIKAFNAGVLEGYLHYDLGGEWRISNGTAPAVWGVDATTGVQSLGIVPGARIPAGDITDSHISSSGITTRTKLPSTLAYEDEANVFTQNQKILRLNPAFVGDAPAASSIAVELKALIDGVAKSSWRYVISNNTWTLYEEATGFDRFRINAGNGTLEVGTVPGARIPSGDINRAHVRLTDLTNATSLATDATGQIVAGTGVPNHDHTSAAQGGSLGLSTVGTGQLSFQAVTYDKIGPSQVRNDNLDSITGCSQGGYYRVNGWCMAVDGVGSLVIFSSGNGGYVPAGLTGFGGKIFIIGARMKKSSGGRGNFCIIPNLSSVTGCDSLSSSSTPVGAVINSVEIEVAGSILTLASSTIIGTTDSELKFFCSNTFGGSIECRAYVLGYM